MQKLDQHIKTTRTAALCFVGALALSFVLQMIFPQLYESSGRVWFMIDNALMAGSGMCVALFYISTRQKKLLEKRAAQQEKENEE